MNDLRFSIAEIISLIGIVQCVYVLVYMAMRAGSLTRAGLPMLYFLTLALAFLFDFSANYIGSATDYYFYGTWIFWTLCPPLSVLMALQIAQINQGPALQYYAFLLCIPASLLLAWAMTASNDACPGLHPCEERRSWLVLSGMLGGGISLLGFWANRDLFALLTAQKLGKDRYWLVLALFFTNSFLLLTMLAGLNDHAGHDRIALIRSILGLAFVYLVSTSLFRIYPLALKSSSPDKEGALSNEEIKIAEKIKNLLTLEKVYHEPTYSRTDLARECNVPETTITKIVNLYFRKSYPQLMNEYRVGDAKRMLHETNANIQIIASEVGFNSVVSFNRVFKDLTGLSPGQYRKSADKS